MSNHSHSPTAAIIRQALGVLTAPGSVVEIRIPGARTRSGYFDDLDLAAAAAAKLNGTSSVYQTLNPCDPALLARAANRIIERPKATTSDRDILRRMWFPIDYDPVRPSQVSSTDVEHEAAIARAREVFAYLRSQGWPDPIIADSGNGGHQLYKIDLPNDAESTDLLKRCLQALSLRFSDELVRVDETVFNSARIWKIYGTVACKGDSTLERPHRQAKLLQVPGELEVVSLDKLTALADAAPKPSQGDARYSGGERFDLDRWISDHGLDVAGPVEWSGGRKWIFRVCPWNEEHRNRSAYIVQFSSGAIAAGCHHNGCNDKGWAALRAMYEPEYREAEHRGPARDEDGAHQSERSQPLPDGLPPVAGFDFALLPDTLRPWAEDICERIQCAGAYVGTAIIAAVGSVIGRKLGIRPQAHTDWTEYGNQWALLIGRPGVLKSPAMEQALGPIRRLAAQAIEAHKGEMRKYTANVKVAKENDEEPPEKPILKRYVANDTTAAALGELHRQNPNGVLVHRDEAVSLLRSLDREENSEARGFYLTGWNGNSPYTFDRIIRGLNLHIPAVCLSLLGSSQPGRIGSYLRAACTGGAGDDGLIQRFGLLVWPDTSRDWRDVDRWPNAEAKRAAFELFDYLDKVSGFDLGGQQGQYEETPFLRFDDGGLELFQQWRRDLEARLRSEELHPALESHLAKYRKLIPGLALILHVAGRGSGPVSEKATLQALAWAEFLESHAARAYASVTMAHVLAARAILARLRKGDLPRTFAGRDIQRKGWAQLSDRRTIADALSLLVDLGWLSERRHETDGRTATVYEVNPRAMYP